MFNLSKTYGQKLLEFIYFVWHGLDIAPQADSKVIGGYNLAADYFHFRQLWQVEQCSQRSFAIISAK